MNQNKKNIVKNSHNANTIDEKHTEMLNYFNDLETNIIPKLMKEKKSLKDKLRDIDNSKIDVYMDIRDNINKLSQEIKQLKGKKKDYLLENSKHIFEYFEEKKKVSCGDNNQNVNILNSFFKIFSTFVVTLERLLILLLNHFCLSSLFLLLQHQSVLNFLLFIILLFGHNIILLSDLTFLFIFKLYIKNFLLDTLLITFFKSSNIISSLFCFFNLFPSLHFFLL
jgi:hypothetical protein